MKPQNNEVHVQPILKGNEPIFREMFYLTRIGIAQANIATRRFLWVNEAFCRITGYTETELLALTVDDLNHPEDQEINQVNYHNLLKGDSYQSEKRYLRKDGTIVWVLATGNVIRDAQGQPIRAFVMVQDITDQKQLEAQSQASQTIIQKNEKLLRLTLDLNAIGLWEWEVATGKVQWNDQNYRLLGYEPGEVEPSYQRWCDHIHPDDRAEVKRKLKEALDNKTDYQAEFRTIKKDGTIHWELGKGCALYDENGQPMRMLGMAFDITSRKIIQLNEQFLNDLEKQLRSLEHSDEIIQEAIRRLGEYLQVERIVWHEVKVSEDITIITQDWRRAKEIPSIIGTYQLSEFILPELIDQYRQGEPVTVEDVATHPYTCPFAENFRERDIGGFISIPCLDKGEWVAILAVNSRKPQKWTYEQVKLLQQTVSRLWPLITEKKALEALAYHEQLLGLALTGSKTGSWTWDLETDQLIWSEEVYYLHGLDPRDGIPQYKEWFDRFLHPDDRPWVYDYIHQVIEQRLSELKLEFRILHPKKGIRWILSLGHVICDQQGKPIRLSGINLDITDNKETELTLQRKVRKEHLLGEITQAIAQNNEVDSILQATVQQVREFLQVDRVVLFQLQSEDTGEIVSESVSEGYPEIMGTNFTDLCLIQRCGDYYRLGEVSAMEDIESVKVEPCYLELMTQFQIKAKLVVPILSQKGQLWGLIIAHHGTAPRFWQPDEIELLKQLATQLGIALQKAELNQNNAQQAALIDIASDGIFVQDLENRILFWNQGAERLYGWTANEAVNKIALDLFHQESLSFLETALQTTLKQGFWSGELKQVNKQGKNLIVLSRWTLMKDSQENPRSILIVNSDITEKKDLEKQLFHAQRLESVGTLASGIAHDLNNILTPLLGVSQLLPLKFKNLDEQTLHLLDILKINTRRAAEIVKQVLLFSSSIEPKSKVISLSDILKELINLLRETFPKNIRIEAELSPNLWIINGDSTQLHQVFMNLCVNARDAMPEGGNLIILADNLTIDPQYSSTDDQIPIGRYVVLTFKDTGIGISPEIIDRIFDPFFTTKPVGQGTGLGLSTAMTIIKNHGGIIRFKSDRREKKGTEFQIYLPAIDKPNLSLLKVEENLPLGEQELILVVDDESSILDITQLTLENYNYRVITAMDGVEAMAIYAQKFADIDLVLTDLTMPEIDGFMTMRALKRINPDVKLIATSGLASLERIKSVESIGIKGFLNKPYNTEQLLSIITKVKNMK